MSKKPSISAHDHHTVIICRDTPGLDSFSALLAAQKLYQEAPVAFEEPECTDKHCHFINLNRHLFNITDIQKSPATSPRRLIIVGTSCKQDLTKHQELLNTPGIEVHIYNHHNFKKCNISADYHIEENSGAVTTLLVLLLKEKNISITPEEATFLYVGIYDGTGGFTYTSTTPKDFTAAEHLLKCKAKVNTVPSLLKKDIDTDFITLLNEMIQESRQKKIHNFNIMITNVSMDDNSASLEQAAQELLRMQSPHALFIFARLKDTIRIIACSNTEEIDTRQLLTPLGGSGHTFQATATLTETTLAEAETKLYEILERFLEQDLKAEDLMSSPAITISSEQSCKRANVLLTRYNINVLLVIDETEDSDALMGYISRQVVAKALQHKFDDALVRDFMTTEFACIGPNADLMEIKSFILGNNQRVMPVIDNGNIVGVITRTNLLQAILGQSHLKNIRIPDPNRDKSPAQTKNINKIMEDRIDPEVLSLFKKIGETAERLSYKAYAIGGFARDLLLSRKNDDIDIVIEGDGILFAKEFASMVNARVNIHKKFRTAVIIMQDQFKIDVASARMEYYKSPAALPTVEMSSIKLDLFRRDFTINTIAIQLNPSKFGILIDFFSAQKDLNDKAIRIIHNLSFVEDPTRAFRAVRFEQRFGFEIGKLTSNLIENAVRMNLPNKLSGFRVLNEIKHIFDEEDPAPAIKRLFDYNLLNFVHPSLKPGDALFAHLESSKKVLAWHDISFPDAGYERWLVIFMLLIRSCKKNESEAICERLSLPPKQSQMVIKKRFKSEGLLVWINRRQPASNKDLYFKLKPLDTEHILYVMILAKNEEVRKSLAYFHSELRKTHISINGNQLKKMGVKPGPDFKRILDAVMGAKLNGSLTTPKEELLFAEKFITEHRLGLTA